MSQPTLLARVAIDGDPDSPARGAMVLTLLDDNYPLVALGQVANVWQAEGLLDEHGCALHDPHGDGWMFSVIDGGTMAAEILVTKATA